MRENKPDKSKTRVLLQDIGDIIRLSFLTLLILFLGALLWQAFSPILVGSWFSLDWFMWVVVTLGVLSVFLPRREGEEDRETGERRLSWKDYLLAIGFGTAAGLAMYIIWQGRLSNIISILTGLLVVALSLIMLRRS